MTFSRVLSFFALILAPLFFASNLLFGKVVIPNIEPWTLAFIRWGLVSLILLPFVTRPLFAEWSHIRRNLPLFAIMGFLAMWICGALVYYALSLTTATNATLIYLSAPVIIIIAEALVRGRRISLREGIGIAAATLGVATILLRGDFNALFHLQFNGGDLTMVFAAIAWAVYSVVFKNESLVRLPSTLLLFLFSASAAVLLAPFALVEVIYVSPVPTSLFVWLNISGIIFSSSLAAFLAYQHSVRTVGPALAGIFMYLLPGYGVGLAVLLLGEKFEHFHLVGVMTILGGVILATFPVAMVRRLRKPVSEGI